MKYEDKIALLKLLNHRLEKHRLLDGGEYRNMSDLLMELDGYWVPLAAVNNILGNLLDLSHNDVQDISKIKKLDDLTLTSDQVGWLYIASQLKSLKEIREVLQPFYDDLVLYYDELLDDEYNDTRSGTETYGYQNLETIKLCLSFISDRWECAFRVRWLIELINPKFEYVGV